MRLVAIAVRPSEYLGRLDLGIALMIDIALLRINGAGIVAMMAIFIGLAMHLLSLCKSSSTSCHPVLHLHPAGARLLHVDRGVFAGSLRSLADWVDLSHLDHLRFLLALNL